MRANLNRKSFQPSQNHVLVFVFSCLFFGCATDRAVWPTDTKNISKVSGNKSGLIRLVSFQSEELKSEPDASVNDSTKQEETVEIENPSLGDLSVPWSSDDDHKPDLLLRPLSLFERLTKDQLRFYSAESTIPLALVFGTGAIVANTQLDNQIQTQFRTSIDGASSDHWFDMLKASKELGNGYYALPVFGAAWLANEWIGGSPAFETIGTWGERSMRGFLVGGGPMIAGQYLTGGARPNELGKGSHWNPLQDNNGVSGHAFVSALPFITAAKMTDNPYAKLAFYSGSALGPLSRMNDEAHYASQIGIGWCIAYLSASAVDHTKSDRQGWSLKPLPTDAGSGLAAEYIW